MAYHPADLANHIQQSASVVNQTIATDTTTNGTAVDMIDTDGPVYGLYTTGNAGDASTVILIKLQEADTSGGSYSDVSGATVTKTASATANDNLAALIKGTRTKRFVRAVVVTSGGGTPSVPIAVQVVAFKKFGVTTTGYSTT